MSLKEFTRGKKIYGASISKPKDAGEWQLGSSRVKKVYAYSPQQKRELFDPVEYGVYITTPGNNFHYDIGRDGVDDVVEITLKARTVNGIADSIEFEYKVEEEGEWTFFGTGVLNEITGTWLATGSLTELDLGNIFIRAVALFEDSTIEKISSLRQGFLSFTSIIITNPNDEDWFDYYIDGELTGFDPPSPTYKISETFTATLTGATEEEVSFFGFQYSLNGGVWTLFENLASYSEGVWSMGPVTLYNTVFIGSVSYKAVAEINSFVFYSKQIDVEYTKYDVNLSSPSDDFWYDLVQDGDGTTVDVSLFVVISGGTADSVEFEYNVNGAEWIHFADGIAGVGDGLGTWSATGVLVEADIGDIEIRAIATFETTREIISNVASGQLTKVIIEFENP